MRAGHHRTAPRASRSRPCKRKTVRPHEGVVTAAGRRGAARSLALNTAEDPQHLLPLLLPPCVWGDINVFGHLVNENLFSVT